MSEDFGQASIVLEDGTELSGWSDYSINSDFLTPTDGWTFTFSNLTEWERVRKLVRPDCKVQILVDGALQLTGWIDQVDASITSRDGLSIGVQGRDVLAALCDANVHPDSAIKKKTLVQLVEGLLKFHYPIDAIPTLFTDNNSNREVLTGVKGYFKGKSRKKIQTEIDYCKPQVNEGAFEFAARNLRRFGMWMWASSDGNVVVSGPDYDQSPAYRIIHREGEKKVTVERARYTWSTQQAPSFVVVRSKSTSKEFERSAVQGVVADESRKLFIPRYIVHDQATDDAQAQAFAEQELTEATKNAKVYHCMLRGHRDLDSGAIYAIDTVVHIEDDYLGVYEDMYVKERTFHKGLQGTFTELKCVPKGSIRFSDVDHAAE